MTHGLSGAAQPTSGQLPCDVSTVAPATSAGPLRAERCACGGLIEAQDDPCAIFAAVRQHQEQGQHAEWRRRNRL